MFFPPGRWKRGGGVTKKNIVPFFHSVYHFISPPPNNPSSNTPTSLSTSSKIRITENNFWPKFLILECPTRSSPQLDLLLPERKALKFYGRIWRKNEVKTLPPLSYALSVFPVLRSHILIQFLTDLLFGKIIFLLQILGKNLEDISISGAINNSGPRVYSNKEKRIFRKKAHEI